jgi:hypothetical protein
VLLFEAARAALAGDTSAASALEPQERAPISILSARRLVKILLDRSLANGLLDSCRLHDIVREFAMQRFDARETKAAHRNIVEAVRRGRPDRCRGTRARVTLNHS